MTRRISIFLIAIGLLFVGAGSWEALASSPLVEETLAGDEKDVKRSGQSELSSNQIENQSEKENVSADDNNTETSYSSEMKVKATSTEVQTENAITKKDERRTITRTAPSNSSSQQAERAKKENAQPTATFSIHGSGGQTVLSARAVTLVEGDTVFDVLQRATQATGVQMEYRGWAHTLYVEGIDNLYEFDEGPESGWMYRVNGVFPNKSAGIYDVDEGDVIEWLYTRDLGRDIGAEF
ncbi:DUF4430 domain-containing protein [Mechercharimyces sp. CAU 1602]|uniref:DUF4430 domain-containing protein n=1 Tax=Mechercharimyces sp. CAU 1602 TaxID=2973933 RepID=UPI002162BC8F|nr:DUF4430 domain-containing protein [Mechercharimyces sp. CAU 1602]MCS1350012.1 DUF4430 domain-containing protein [Mechercharimyces sp. CAU 1602]